jgi:hypothetical protein
MVPMSFFGWHPSDFFCFVEVVVDRVDRVVAMNADAPVPAMLCIEHGGRSSNNWAATRTAKYKIEGQCEGRLCHLCIITDQHTSSPPQCRLRCVLPRPRLGPSATCGRGGSSWTAPRFTTIRSRRSEWAWRISSAAGVLDILPVGSFYEWKIAYWKIIVVSLLLPTRSVQLRLRARRQRLLAGHCRNCGYDLRSSPECCPECGTLICEDLRRV